MTLKREILELAMYVVDHDTAWDILAYLKRKKSATVYQIAEAIRRDLTEIQGDLGKLAQHKAIKLAEGLKLTTPVYMITAYGDKFAREFSRQSIRF